MKEYNKELIYRIIDANRNRLKEGLRVCEDIVRFILEDKNLTASFKGIRHKVTDIVDKDSSFINKMLKCRKSDSDIGREIKIKPAKRSDFKEIFTVNMQRCKEAVRVLEEFNRLFSQKTGKKLEDIRFKLYELEKKIRERF